MTTRPLPTPAPRRPRMRLAVALAALATTVLGLAPAPVGAADPASPEEFVGLVYEVCLDRAPEQAGLDHWLGVYGVPDAQAGAQRMAGAICWGEESLAPTIEETFAWILDRDPSADDLAYWTPRIRNRGPLHLVERHVFVSPERYAASGGTDEGYVADLFPRILDRPASAADVTYWAGRLASGEHRVRTVDALLGSAEARHARVTRIVAAAVDRPPTEWELSDGDYVLKEFRDPRLAKSAFLEIVVLSVP